MTVFLEFLVVFLDFASSVINTLYCSKFLVCFSPRSHPSCSIVHSCCYFPKLVPLLLWFCILFFLNLFIFVVTCLKSIFYERQYWKWTLWVLPILKMYLFSPYTWLVICPDIELYVKIFSLGNLKTFLKCLLTTGIPYCW